MARKLPIPNGRLDGALDANGMRIVNLADPLSDDDAATKGFVRKNAVNAGVRSIGGKSGDLSLEDIGALPVEKDLPNGRTVVFVAADGWDTAKAEMYLNAAGEKEAAMHVGDTPDGRGKLSVANGPGGEGVGVFGKAYGEVKVAEHAGVAAVEISGSFDIDQYPPTPHGSIHVRGDGASIKKNGEEVATVFELEAVAKRIGAAVEISGEYEDGTTFSFNFLTAGA